MHKQKQTGVDLRRPRWGEAEARVALGEWRRSGKSLAVFARELGVSSMKLGRWRQRLGGQQEDIPMPSARPLDAKPVWVPLEIAEAPPMTPALSDPVVVVLGAEVRVEVGALTLASAAWVAQLARSMNEARR